MKLRYEIRHVAHEVLKVSIFISNHLLLNYTVENVRPIAWNCYELKRSGFFENDLDLCSCFIKGTRTDKCDIGSRCEFCIISSCTRSIHNLTSERIKKCVFQSRGYNVFCVLAAGWTMCLFYKFICLILINLIIVIINNKLWY